MNRVYLCCMGGVMFFLSSVHFSFCIYHDTLDEPGLFVTVGWLMLDMSCFPLFTHCGCLAAHESMKILFHLSLKWFNSWAIR